MKLKLDEEKMCGLKAKRKHVDEDVLFVTNSQKIKASLLNALWQKQPKTKRPSCGAWTLQMKWNT